MRYSGSPKRLYDFMDSFNVTCPRCKCKASVELPYFLDYRNATLSCKVCHFAEKMTNRIRFVLSGKAKCVQCNEWLNLDIEAKKKIPKYQNIKCDNCKTINKVKENWAEIYLKYYDEGITDPAFGLPLWYCDTVKGDIIWAYNAEHLKEIKSYVASKLRERSTDKFKMTMVEKLPDFIKESKNRDEVLRAIERMENK